MFQAFSTWGSGRGYSVKAASSELLMVVIAERDYRANDRDGNGIKDYWVGDVCGLSRMLPRSSDKASDALRLILWDEADAQPISLPAGRIRYAPPDLPDPYGIFWWYSVIPLDGDGRPYAEDLDGDGAAFENESRFAVCAYPGPKCPPRFPHTYIVDDTGRIWRKDIGGKPVERYPKSPEAEGWQFVREIDP